jgi:hypothetical protein
MASLFSLRLAMVLLTIDRLEYARSRLVFLHAIELAGFGRFMAGDESRLFVAFAIITGD